MCRTATYVQDVYCPLPSKTVGAVQNFKDTFISSVASNVLVFSNVLMNRCYSHFNFYPSPSLGVNCCISTTRNNLSEAIKIFYCIPVQKFDHEDVLMFGLLKRGHY